MTTQKDFDNTIRSLLPRMPQIEPFFFVVPLKVLTPEEYALRVPPPMPQTAACTYEDFIFHAGFLSSLTPAQQRGLVLHEILHGALEHLSHPWVDNSLARESFYKLRNIAQDVVVENFITEMAELDQPGIAPDKRFIQNCQELPCWFADYKGWNWRDVYDDLRQKADVTAPSYDHHGEPCEDTPVDKEARAEAQRLWKAAQRASEAARAVIGDAKGADSIAVKPDEARIPWQDTLADFLTSIPSPERKSWNRVKRRPFCTRGEYHPVKTGETPALDHVYVFVDTSGSMHATLGKVAGDVLNLLKVVQVNTVELVYYDVGVQRRDVIEYDDMEDYTIESMPGGGGTAVFPAMREVVEDPDFVEGAPFVVLTDGYDDYTIGDLPTSPLVWLSYSAPVKSDRGVSLLVR